MSGTVITPGRRGQPADKTGGTAAAEAAGGGG
jgi:hypothetical protein